MPWIGYGTYRLGKAQVVSSVKGALQLGYKQIDTAFIYGGETTEKLVGQAIREAVDEGILSNRKDVFITTKQWRSYHGYDNTLKCLQLSLERLGVDYIDLWLMHHPGPAWKQKSKVEGDEDDLWKRTIHGSDIQSSADMKLLRAETWRAMECAYKQGKVKAIGVCNMSVGQLEHLRRTGTIVPMVHQCEVHPLHPQDAVLQYCSNHDIVITAYASLGGQDTNRVEWARLLGDAATVTKSPMSKHKRAKAPPSDLLHAAPVVALAEDYHVTPAQILLRWALEQNCAIIPKTASFDRMRENTSLFSFSLSMAQVEQLRNDLQSQVQSNLSGDTSLEETTRLCWRGDPLRTLDY